MLQRHGAKADMSLNADPGLEFEWEANEAHKLEQFEVDFKLLYYKLYLDNHLNSYGEIKWE